MNASPSFLLLGRGKNPHTVRWSVKDRTLATAVIQLEDEKCPSCGTPYWLGHTSHSGVEYDIRFDQCLACAELEDATKDVTFDAAVRPYVKAVGTPVFNEDGEPTEQREPLPSRAEALAVPNDVEVSLPRR